MSQDEVPDLAIEREAEVLDRAHYHQTFPAALAQEPCCIYQPRNWKPREEGEPAAICQPEQSGTLVTL